MKNSNAWLSRGYALLLLCLPFSVELPLVSARISVPAEIIMVVLLPFTLWQIYRQFPQLLPAFRHSGPTAAIVSTLAGVATFAVANFVFQGPFVATTGLPVVVSAVSFIGLGLVNRGRAVAPEVDDLLEAINEDRVVPQPSPATTATGLERGS